MEMISDSSERDPFKLFSLNKKNNPILDGTRHTFTFEKL